MSIDSSPSSAGDKQRLIVASRAYLWPRLLPASNITAVIVAGVSRAECQNVLTRNALSQHSKAPRRNKQAKIKEKGKGNQAFTSLAAAFHLPPVPACPEAPTAEAEGERQHSPGGEGTPAPTTRTQAHSYIHKLTNMHTWDDLRWDGTDTKCNMQHAES